MKIIITHQSNSISFEIEENLPEHEAFEVLRAFTVSAFENLPDDLVYSLSGVDEPFQMHDPKDWKEGKQKHFRGSVICLTVVDPSAEADSDDSDSYVHITDNGEEDKKIAKEDEQEVAKPASVQQEDAEEENVVIEDYDSEDELEDKETDEEEEEVQASAEGDASPRPSPRALCKRVKEFIVEIGSESLQNIAAVVHTLVTEGNVNLSDAIRTAMETSEKAANHPLTQDLLAIIDVYVQKFNSCNWQGMLSQFNIEQIVALIPGIVDALTRSMEGAQDVELDLSPLMMQFCPMLAQMQSCIPNGEERVFPCNPQNPFAVFQQAQQQMQAEFPQQCQNAATHHGVVCDGCNMSPIVGVRYKSVLRADYDLCEECEKEHDPKDPLIKIKTPIQDLDVLPGLSEFRRSIGGGRGRRCPRRGGRGRGRGCRPRRGCRRSASPPSPPMRAFPGCGRPNGPGPMRAFAQMMQNSPLAQAMREQMRERFCEPEPASSADRRDPARQMQEEDPVAAKQAEVEQKKQEVREAKAKVKALKKEMKVCRKEMKKVKKQQKKSMKKLDGEVTGHLDTEEKSTQKPGATVLKTWKVKNIGSTTWSDDTIAIFHSGNQSLVVPGYEVIQVGSLEPNDVAYIRCMLSVPDVEGTYSLTYRLSGPQGKFGGRLTTEFEVVAEKETSMEEPKVTFTSEPGKNIPAVIDVADEDKEPPKAVEIFEPKPSAPVQPEPVEQFQFQKQKDQLKMMGFEMDDETLESVLVACKGDIGQAIQLLM
eukprot:UN21190